MMSYARSCRLCLADLTEPPVDCSTIPEIYETVTVLFNVQICRTDNIRSICNGCLDYVMGYRALKKKIAECQKIIEDYENVRKKVMENRNSGTLVIKQEIVDVEAYTCTQTGTNKIKRSRPTAVTDSDINDILALVHDSSGVPRRGKAPRAIKTEPQSPKSIEVENESQPREPISSTSKDLTEHQVLTEKGSFSESTSAEETSTDSTKSLETSAHRPLDTKSQTQIDAQAVTSSETETNQQISKISTRKRANSSITPPAIRSRRRQTQNSPENQQISNDCKICPLKFKLIADLKSHLRKNHKVKLEDLSDTSLNADPKSSKDDSVSSTDNQNTSMRRSTRQAKTQKLQEDSSIIPKSPVPCLRRSNRMEKIADTPNNSLVEPQLTSTPMSKTEPSRAKKSSQNNNMSAVMNQSVKSENMSSTLGNSTFLKDTSLNNSKRIITITLVRTKDSLNFRYCDQYKRNIDFKNVSVDELEEMRKSLLVPEIWNNLREAFRNSPPDDKTFDQLKAILGDDFIL